MTGDSWPRDPPGWIFAKRSVDRIGKAMFGDQWTGMEQHTAILPPMAAGDRRPGNVWPIILAMHGRGKDVPVETLDRARWRGTTLKPPATPTIAESEMARMEVEEQRARVAPYFGRLNAVIDAAVPWLETGRVECALRHDETGLMDPLALHFWNGDMPWLRQRFAIGRVDLAAPFSISTAGRWLFFKDSGLQQLEAFVRPHAPAGASWLPAGNERVDAWSVRGDVERGARERIEAQGTTNPSEAAICREMEAMCAQKWTWKTIQKKRGDARVAD